MPGTIAHIVYTQKFLKQKQINDYKNNYVIGSLIPDIRYLGVLPRDITHINLDDQAWIKASQLVHGQENIDLFKKGFLFHNFLDHWWAKKYPISTTDWFKGTALKWYQDLQLYSLIRNVEELQQQLKTIPYNFSLSGVNQYEFERWIKLLIDYLAEIPTIDRQIEIINKYKLLPEDSFQTFKAALNQVSEDEKTQFITTLDQFLPQNLPKLLLT